MKTINIDPKIIIYFEKLDEEYKRRLLNRYPIEVIFLYMHTFYLMYGAVRLPSEFDLDPYKASSASLSCQSSATHEGGFSWQTSVERFNYHEDLWAATLLRRDFDFFFSQFPKHIFSINLEEYGED